MRLNYFNPRLMIIACFGLCALIGFYPEKVSAAAASAGKVFNFDDQYVQLEAGIFPGESRSAFGIEVTMTPKPGWKILAGNSSGVKALRLKFSPAKCLKMNGATQISPADWSGTDDSGAFSEYFTKTASLRQEFSTQKCTQKNGLEGRANLTYLLCQDNRCVGPFSREFRFKAPERK